MSSEEVRDRQGGPFVIGGMLYSSTAAGRDTMPWNSRWMRRKVVGVKVSRLVLLLMLITLTTYGQTPSDDQSLRIIGAIIRSHAPKAAVIVGPPPTFRNSTKRFVRDPNLPFVYLAFDRIGKGIRFSEDEPTTRVWLRVVNNCVVPIRLQTFGPPDGVSPEEVGLIHEVVASAAGNISGRKPADRCNLESAPLGYMFDVSSVNEIRPGDTILFSVPVTHLSKCWQLEIPFELALPEGKGPRDPLIGGEPVMRLRYSAWDLPPSVQAQIE